MRYCTTQNSILLQIYRKSSSWDETFNIGNYNDTVDEMKYNNKVINFYNISFFHVTFIQTQVIQELPAFSK